MKKCLFIALVCLIGCQQRASEDAPPSFLSPSGVAVNPSRILVMYRNEALPRALDLPEDVTPDAAIAAVQTSQEVEFAEYDYLVHALELLPDDPFFPELWGLDNIGQLGGTIDADIDAPAAWQITTGNQNFVVAVIDSGIDVNHPDLAPNLWVNPDEIAGNGIDDDGNNFVDDVHGVSFCPGGSTNLADEGNHGTHVAGTIGARGDNGIGVAGVNWNVQIMTLKFLCGSAGVGATSNAIAALNYALSKGVKLSNNSWGGGGVSAGLSNAISNAQAQGHIFVAAAGNSGVNTDLNPHYPSALPNDNIIAVAALNRGDGLASFSNFGLDTVDLAAPGVEIKSTTPGNNFSTFNGTSMAAPHVTGVAALLWGHLPQLSASQVIARIIDSGDFAPSLDSTTVSGKRLNAFGALTLKELDLSAVSDAVTLVWSAPAQPMPPFSVRRATVPGGPFTEIATVPAQANTFIDEGLATNTTYYYRLEGAAGAVTGTPRIRVLPPPTGVTASLFANKVSIQWQNDMLGESGYEIERANAGSGNFQVVASRNASTTNFVDPDSNGNSTFQYRVRAVARDSRSGPSAVVSLPPASVGPVAPGQVSNLSAIPLALDRVSLSWSHSMQNVTSFSIERAKDSPTVFVPLASVPVGVSTYLDASAPKRKHLFYRIRAHNGALPGAYSSVIEVITDEPRAPSGISVTLVSAHVAVNWADNSPSETHFEVVRTGGGAGTVRVTRPANATAFFDSTVLPNRTYTYWVRAINHIGSNASGTRSIRTPK